MLDQPFLPVNFDRCQNLQRAISVKGDRCRWISCFGTTAGVMRSDLRFVGGEELLSHWESSPGVFRYFASCCGSPIFKRDRSNPDQYGFRLGTLDSDPGAKVTLHYMVDSKAPWVEICDSLDQEPGSDGPFPGNQSA